MPDGLKAKVHRFHTFQPHKTVQAIAICPNPDCKNEVLVGYGGTQELVKGLDAATTCRKCGLKFTVQPYQRRKP